MQREAVAMFSTERDALAFKRQEIMARRADLTNVSGRIEEPRDFDTELEHLVGAILDGDPVEMEFRRARMAKMLSRLIQAGDAWRSRVASRVIGFCAAEDPKQYMNNSINAVNRQIESGEMRLVY